MRMTGEINRDVFRFGQQFRGMLQQDPESHRQGGKRGRCPQTRSRPLRTAHHAVGGEDGFLGGEFQLVQ
ncbi:MAG: hypothetical protein CMM63_05865 [Rhodospirillaceae bacterium]|nr:hypothetical protein [Rhodospirillaceae bacterium]